MYCNWARRQGTGRGGGFYMKYFRNIFWLTLKASDIVKMQFCKYFGINKKGKRY